MTSGCETGIASLVIREPDSNTPGLRWRRRSRAQISYPTTKPWRPFRFPIPTDAHVVATAVAAQATTIVTYNGSHFPAAVLAPFRLRQETPDAFCRRLFDEAREGVVEGARLHRASLKRPPFDPDLYLDHLQSQLELKQTADLLRMVQDLI
jgi:hypothetical protein